MSGDGLRPHHSCEAVKITCNSPPFRFHAPLPALLDVGALHARNYFVSAALIH